ncbi:MAG: PRC-barrel domain-containing protein [Allosphingosinicella sp.]
MRLGDLYGAPVRTEDGERLGAVLEVYAKGGRVVRLGVGAANLIERLLPEGRRGRQVAWDDVVALEGGKIVVARRKSGSA